MSYVNTPAANSKLLSLARQSTSSLAEKGKIVMTMPTNFFFNYCHVIPVTCKYCRREKVSIFQIVRKAIHPYPSITKGGTFFYSHVNILQYCIVLVLMSHRSNIYIHSIESLLRNCCVLSTSLYTNSSIIDSCTQTRVPLL